MSLKRTAVILALCLLPLIAGAAAPRGKAGERFALQSFANGTWRVAYSGVRLVPRSLTISGRAYAAFTTEASALAGKAGNPALPCESITLGVPRGGSLAVSLLDPVYEILPSQDVAPVPSYQSTDSTGTLRAVYIPNSAIYATNRLFPEVNVETGPPRRMRDQWTAAIVLHPYQFNPVTKQLRRLVSGTLEIHLVGPTAAASGTITSDPRFETLYRATLWNYEQAKAWRVQTRALAKTAVDSSGSWFTPGTDYVRLAVPADGWYRVHVDSIAEFSGADFSRLQMFNAGHEVPLVVHPDSTVEFYGRMRHGDSSYYDFYSDTNMYWLVRGAGNGLRFQTINGVTGATTAASAWNRLHCERNVSYYFGATTPEVMDPSQVAGEGWMWEYFYPNTVHTYSFSIDSVDRAASPTAHLSARLFGTTTSTSPPDNHARFWVNDSLAGDVSFNGRTEGRLDVNFPQAWLRRGANVLKIQSIPTSAPYPQFGLDWFEVGYQRALLAVGDTLTFTPDAALEGMRVRFSVAGFSTPPNACFDVVHGRRIAPDSTWGSGSNFGATFTDTAHATSVYCVAVPGGTRTVSQNSVRTFGDLRAHPTGADYIIVTHASFLGAAATLATYRASHNGVRALVVDVQDLYDQFNFGLEDATAIKRFLQYAYASWPRPAPTYVLMLGDATWDPHHYQSSATKLDFVPIHGVPSGDNWVGQLDSSSSPVASFLIGRISVQSAAQAASAVAKVIESEQYPLGDWVKRWLFVTGGASESEQSWMNNSSEYWMATYLVPPPIGGKGIGIYKATPWAIDGEHRQEIRDHITRGTALLNYFGHAGGTVWGVDVGDPGTMDNVGGPYPFVISVSCNVGAFADPNVDVLSENFMLADHRGAIGVWASATLGDANIGSLLAENLFSAIALDSLRTLGELTNVARTRVYNLAPSNTAVIAEVQLCPLQGDPLTAIALPRAPDLAILPGDISAADSTGARADTGWALKVRARNFGLVPTDSVSIHVQDLFQGRTIDRGTRKVAPIMMADSIVLRWNASSEAGNHAITAEADPGHLFPDVNWLNNSAVNALYLYSHSIDPVKPLPFSVVLPGTQTLVVSVRRPQFAAGVQVVFELDTVSSFDSPWKVASSAVTPTMFSARWTTPSLGTQRAYYWRAHTVESGVYGPWATASFSVGSSVPSAPQVRWSMQTQGQLSLGQRTATANTDSGVVVAGAAGAVLTARSLGIHSTTSTEDYGFVAVNGVGYMAYPWIVGTGIIAARVNQFDASSVNAPFNTPGDASQADSLLGFINATPTGDYLIFSAVQDGRTNMTEAVRTAMEALGSTLFRTMAAGDSWVLIGRKGYPSVVQEQRNGDTATASLTMANYFRAGTGVFTSPAIAPPYAWHALHWRSSAIPAGTSIHVALVRLRQNGTADTLRMLTEDSLDVSLAGDTALTAAGVREYRLCALLSTTDAERTPRFSGWWVDLEPPADPALELAVKSAGDAVVPNGVPLSVPLTWTNLGFRGIDSCLLSVGVYNAQNVVQPIQTMALGRVAVDSVVTASAEIPTSALRGRSALELAIVPVDHSGDLIQGNDNTTYSLNVAGAPVGAIQVFADGQRIQNGDYIAARPKIRFESAVDATWYAMVGSELVVDGKAWIPGASGGTPSASAVFAPLLANGRHDLAARMLRKSIQGVTDTLRMELSVNVLDEMHVLNLFNFPNPFSNATEIIFDLTSPAERIAVRIFTVAGRKIREISLPSNGDMNRVKILWDGRDNDGDEVANGVYFYQVQATGGGKTDSAIGKFARVR